MSGQSLIEMAQVARELSRRLMESGGEITPEMETELSVTGENLPKKVDNYQFVLDEIEIARDLWKKRKDECAAQERQYTKAIERIRDRIRVAMAMLETTELVGNYYRFKLSRSKPKLVISDPSLIPQDLMRITQVIEPDKDRIRAALELGQAVPGCELLEEGALRSYNSSGDKS